MKTTAFLSQPPLSSAHPAEPLPSTSLIIPTSAVPGETIRHILLGRPDAVRQTIRLLHSLRYTETVLWSPVIAIADPLVITPSQGEAMSLLRKSL